MMEELHVWAEFVRVRLDAGKDETAIVPEFEAWLTDRLLAKGVGAEDFESYETALPFAMNVTGREGPALLEGPSLRGSASVAIVDGTSRARGTSRTKDRTGSSGGPAAPEA